jgi:hypothetical protein
MNIAFTICSNNYLAQAKTVGDSFLDFHPNWKFVIGLVDEYDPSFDYSFFDRFEILKVKDIKVPGFDSLVAKYNIVELNTAVKPTYIKYLFANLGAEKLMYIDPDILVTSHFDEIIDALDTKEIVVTPHLCTPVDDEFAPTDYHTLRGGIFNLGFIALARYNKIEDFINWWDDRVLKYGYCDFSKNMFYDQIWINYVPVMFDNYCIMKHFGYNMASWNLHERKFTKSENDNYIVNDVFPLRFYHFSGYKFNKPQSISSHLTRYEFNSRPDLITIFDKYQKLVINNQYEKISKLNVSYQKEVFKVQPKSTIAKLSGRVKKTFQYLLTGTISK